MLVVNLLREEKFLISNSNPRLASKYSAFQLILLNYTLRDNFFFPSIYHVYKLKKKKKTRSTEIQRLSFRLVKLKKQINNK